MSRQERSGGSLNSPHSACFVYAWIMNTVAVIGGGAAGLAAAIAASQASARVMLFESDKRVGQKILKTGNGRCNLTNMQVSPTDYCEPFYMAPFIETYTADRVLDFFDGIGLLTVQEEDGKVYPLSNSANTVLDVLRNACTRLGVETLCEHEVVDLQSASDRFEIACSNKKRYSADRVIVATGGGSELLSCLGHVITHLQPALCPLKTDTKPLRGLSGVRAQAKVCAYETADDAEPFTWLFGEVLFRDYGLSGIVIFDMSREVDAGDFIGMDFLPQVTDADCIEWLTRKYEDMCTYAKQHKASTPTYSELMCGVFHKRLNDAILRRANCKPSAQAQAENIPAIVGAAKDFRVQVTGLGDVSRAQVTRGGAAIDEFDSLTLESKLVPGLFGAGETLSVDGRCGGFNLHWAWASGIAAGTASAEK